MMVVPELWFSRKSTEEPRYLVKARIGRDGSENGRVGPKFGIHKGVGNLYNARAKISQTNNLSPM
jgi:hypothetical protein